MKARDDADVEGMREQRADRPKQTEGETCVERRKKRTRTHAEAHCNGYKNPNGAFNGH